MKTGTQAYTVFALSIDLIKSTTAGLNRTTEANDRFNVSLIQQIKPHLDGLDLAKAVTQFVGDGWVVKTKDVNQLPALCCLAIIMAKKFKIEMSIQTGIGEADIPSLRIAVCSGRDVEAELPDNRIDFVGDSTRRAVRASGYCGENEILINATVREAVFRDFMVKDQDITQNRRSNSKESEEMFPLYVLHELKTEAAASSNAPAIFVYTLGAIGRANEAIKIAERVGERDAQIVKRDPAKRPRIIPGWNSVVLSLPDFKSALGMVDRIKARGLNPDQATYSILIKKAPNFAEGQKLLDAMRKDGLAPDVITYSTLINKADFAEGQKLLDAMRKDGLAPNVITYTSLFKKVLGQSAEKVLKWYLAQPNHPDMAINTGIAVYQNSRETQQALRLALDYAHLPAARKLVRTKPEESVLYYQSIIDENPNHPNAHYALGIAYMEQGHMKKARPPLEKALKLATQETRKTVIREWLRQIQSSM